ncbi:MAG: arginase [Sphingobacteriales bacterium]|nr:MAG: arginase [Sphingobacteriales bacterium]
MGNFIVSSRACLDQFISVRQGETKFGERVETVEQLDWEQSLSQSKAKFVVLGVPEDIGVRANYGVGGTQTLWEPALKALLNVQNTTVLDGTKVMILGAFDFAEMMNKAEGMDITGLRELVGYIDEAVQKLVGKIIDVGKVPIVIGGGHNNAYPLLKAASIAKGGPVNCINLDAHSDYRAMEGRHSGNGFRYAHREGYLERYAVVGLHENYNAQDIIEELTDDPNLHFSYYEDIFIREKLCFYEAVTAAQEHTEGKPLGIELDMDCIENILSSAVTPAGISTIHARQYVNWCAKLAPVYLHLTEGAAKLNDGRNSSTTAKLAAYLVTDFIKAYQNKRNGFFS